MLLGVIIKIILKINYGLKNDINIIFGNINF